ncbi:CAP domain-containing protein [Nostoc sp. FACHB-87]|uniref:CAP domain-containing protein n=1 Tax=Nostocaceae TaxID=1162 RepID=UPI0016841961|nr:MULTISPECIES: CAP domain-containing protein [Nostocaceae]MBD2458664.1 CAP domain-containing protein [Nostoc sp. FACHB-87]MBD2479660.1 CAP domain-containing protein [Anabaena sp. FACHB-83]
MIQNKISSAGVATLALIGGVTAFSAPVQTATLQHTQMSDNNIQLAQTVNTAKLEAEVFTQINQYRASLGLPALTRNSTIDNQARTHSQNMAQGRVAFGHDGFGARIQAIAVTIPYSAAAENVAYNQGYSNPATQAVQGWLRSPGHLANIKGNYNLTGVGVAVNSRGAVYFTQIFIRRR